MFSLNSEGYTEDQRIQLSGGSHVLTASYSGDNSYSASASTYAIDHACADYDHRTTIGQQSCRRRAISGSRGWKRADAVGCGSHRYDYFPRWDNPVGQPLFRDRVPWAERFSARVQPQSQFHERNNTNRAQAN